MSQYGSDPNQPDQGADPYGSAPQNPYGTPPPAPNPYGDASSYGQPPTAAQDPYGAPAANPYGQNPYGTSGIGSGGLGYAPWIKRVGGYLVDGLLTTLAAVPAYVLLFTGIAIGSKNLKTYTDVNGVSHTTGHWNGGGTALVVIGVALFGIPLAFFIWNTCLRQGRTGYTIGKGLLGIRLLGLNSGQPIGGGMSFLRYVCHIVDGLVCYIGYLWPLWDSKCQTFADKIVGTVVVNQPKQG